MFVVQFPRLTDKLLLMCVRLGCLETLVQYKILLRDQYHSGGTGEDVRKMLDKLLEIDPKRKGRYIDIGRALTAQM